MRFNLTDQEKLAILVERETRSDYVKILATCASVHERGFAYKDSPDRDPRLTELSDELLTLVRQAVASLTAYTDWMKANGDETARLLLQELRG